MLKRSLRTHLLLFFILFILLCLVVAPAIISQILGFHFSAYMREKVAEDQRELIQALSTTYTTGKGWDLRRVADIARQTLRGPLFTITLMDTQGGLIWTARKKNAWCGNVL